MKKLLATLAVTALMPAAASASIISVTGPLSSLGFAPEIIAAPSDVLEDFVFNSAMQGFDEAQGVVLPVAIATDQGVIAAGRRVSSHMIFLNSDGRTRTEHFGVEWKFDGRIIGVMSDTGGTLEGASTAFLGAPGTNYTVGAPGEVAPFDNRGMEGVDAYVGVGTNTLVVDMFVTEPGDWIRVVTSPVPVPAAGLLLGSLLLGGGFAASRRKAR